MITHNVCFHGEIKNKMYMYLDSPFNENSGLYCIFETFQILYSQIAMAQTRPCVCTVLLGPLLVAYGLTWISIVPAQFFVYN